jgi:putative transport protein
LQSESIIEKDNAKNKKYMNTIFYVLRHYPELTIFLTLAVGFAIGYIRIGSFKVGAVLGTLFAGVIIGQTGVQVPGIVKIIFFDLFLFATGYKVGPQFFRGLKKDAFPQLVLTLVICTSCLLIAILMSKILRYDVGTAAGMLAGAFTESTVIGTASEAIQRLAIPEAEKTQLINNIPVAYAVTYLIGTTTLVWFLSSMAPKMLRVNLKDASRKLGEKFAVITEADSGIDSAFQEWSIRAYKVEEERWYGRTVSEFENSFPGIRFFIQRIRHEGQIIEPDPNTVIHAGDILALMARRIIIVESAAKIGPETVDQELLNFPIVFREIIISKKQAINKKLTYLALQYGHGIVLRKLIRGGQEIPFGQDTVVNLGDLLKASGRLHDIEQAAKNIGYLEPVSPATDMIFVGMGIFLGGLVGLLALNVGGIALTLTTSGGALVMGLVFGWLHSKTQIVGRIPDAALWIFDNVGLAAFIGIVGLSAGPSFIAGLKQTGFGIIFAGLVVAVLPHIIGLYFGKYVLKMNPVILLGAHSGAGTTTTALKAIQDAAGSKLPVLGYTIPYALGNILLTAWGPLIVAMMT